MRGAGTVSARDIARAPHGTARAAREERKRGGGGLLLVLGSSASECYIAGLGRLYVGCLAPPPLLSLSHVGTR